MADKPKTLLYQNVRSFREPMERISAVSKGHAIIVLTETQLTPNIKNDDLGLMGYEVFRRDPKNSRSGGLLIAVNPSMCSVQEVIPLEVHSLDCLLASMKMGDQVLLIAAVYIPPGSSEEVYRTFAAQMYLWKRLKQSEYKEPYLIIIGNLNIPDYNESGIFLFPNIQEPKTALEIISKMAGDLYLPQYNTVRNNLGLINPVYTNLCGDIDTTKEHFSKIDPAHPPLQITIRYKMPRTYTQNK